LPGPVFRPAPDWSRAHSDREAPFDEMDLADLFATLSGGRRRSAQGTPFAIHGEDFELAAEITVEQAATGTEFEVNLNVVEPSGDGFVRRVPRSFRARIAKSASE
jgi:curved DNA-binding protein